jgi:putative spermidine/putrescine transport system permease protein
VSSIVAPPILRLEEGTKRLLVGSALIAPCLLLVVVFFAYPIAGIVVRSLSDPEIGVGNYVTIFQSAAFRNILWLTLKIALWTTVGCLVLGFPLSWYLTTVSPQRAALLLLLSTSPLWVAILARLYAWTAILGRRGVINETLLAIGMISEPLDLLFNTRAVLIGMIHVMLPFMILILYATMRGIDRSLLDAASSLGGSAWYVFSRIFAPLVAPGVFAASILIFIMSLGFFILPAVLGGGSDITLPVYVQAQIRNFNWGIASAMSIVLLVTTLALFALVIRVFDPSRVLVGGSRH